MNRVAGYISLLGRRIADNGASAIFFLYPSFLFFFQRETVIVPSGQSLRAIR